MKGAVRPYKVKLHVMEKNTNLSHSLSPAPLIQPPVQVEVDQAEIRQQWHLLKQSSGPVYSRIPLASRNKASQIYASLLLKGYTKNGKPEWDKILNFPRCGLGCSQRGGKKHTSQATVVNKRLETFVSGSTEVEPVPKKKTKGKPPKPSQSTFGSRVAAKLGMGDVRGAVNIVTSKESILSPSKETKTLLQAKHPPRKRSVRLDAPASNNFGTLNHFWVSKADVKWGIASFKKGAAGGPDGLRPQHLADMTGQ